MSARTKRGLLVATVLTAVGLVTAVAVMTALHWDFTRLSTVSHTSRTYSVSEPFRNIEIDAGAVRFAPSEDGHCTVRFEETDKVTCSVSVSGETLTVRQKDERKWYDYIGIYTDSPKITVCLPAGEYAALSVTGATGDIDLPGTVSFERLDISLTTGDVTCRASAADTLCIRTTTGDIRLVGVSARRIDLSATTGDRSLENVTCDGEVTLRGTTGETVLHNVTAGGTLSVEQSTGDVTVSRSDAAEIVIKTTTGDVTGEWRTDKVFVTETSTGEVKVPKGTAGGRCEIMTTTGDILFQ